MVMPPPEGGGIVMMSWPWYEKRIGSRSMAL